MRNLLTQASITFAVIFTGLFILWNYVPLDWFTVSNNTGDFGAITTLVGTENLSNFPTTYNANLAQLMRMSTTTLPAVTTMANLVTIGTITTGVWTATDITVANGGTGLSTLTANAVMLGAGTSNVNFVSGLGSSGQFLTSNGASSDPTWQTSSIALGDNYAWTGFHDFAATTSMATGAEAVVAFFGKLMFSGAGTTTLDFSTTAANTASSTVMALDADGKVSHVLLSRLLVAEATATAVTGSAVNLFAHTILANELGGKATLKGSAALEWSSLDGAGDGFELSLQYGGLVVATSSASNTTSVNCIGLNAPALCTGVIEFYMTFDGTNQTGGFVFNGSITGDAPSSVSNVSIGSLSVSQSVSTTADQLFSLVGQIAGSGTIQIRNVYIELISI